jgi:multicomponent K+:H+ antiporter subunit A
MSLSLIAALPFLGALLPGLAIRAGRTAAALAAGSATLAAFVLLLSLAPGVLAGTPVEWRAEWMPALGLTLSFRLDGLSLLFAGLILGIGLLIIAYARGYLAKEDPAGRFFTYLMLFQGAMTGLVLSDNILLMLVFWELTSLSSFLLIGYWRHKGEGRQGARMALAVTGAGGLALIGGALLLGQAAGSYELSVIVTRGAEIAASPLFVPALVLVLAGAFTKSAQFPFHFWLPHAMAAPTPVSAYLHSATMVKAGLYLLARLWPGFAGTEAWVITVTTAGLATMLIAAKIALFKDDLKAILAFSTVSHLGLVTMLLGIGSPAAAVVAVFHILNHATFKAALFMVAGIVDHETHSRDIRRLGGLAGLMPVTFTLGAVAALSMAGVPPLNGFLSKEMMLHEAVHAGLGPAWLLPVLATAGALLSVGYSLRFLVGTFLGPRGADVSADHPPHDPGAGLWGPPAVLVALVVAIGLAPMLLAGPLVAAAAAAVTAATPEVYIKHWHGFGAAALWMSVAALAGGAALLAAQGALRRIWDASPRPEAKAIFDAGLAALLALAARATAALHDGRFARMLVISLAALVALGLWAFLGAPHAAGTRAQVAADPAFVVGWGLLMAVTLAMPFLHRDRLLSLMLVGVMGLMISLGFVRMSAPDLALTQISVEVVSVLLMLLALNFLPERTPVETAPWRRWRDGAVAGAAGLATGALAFVMMTREAAFPVISAYHLEQSKPGAGGTNAVNTIIVDFRGFDTFGEITVLGIAALIIHALADACLRSGPARAQLRAERMEDRAGDRHPLMMAVAARLLLPVAMTVGVFIFLRGHNLPGGGFVAGLVFAIALMMQYIASGHAWAQARQRVDEPVVIALGLLVALACGVGAWGLGLPFLTSGYTYVTLWPLETFELATAAIFDLGVFLTVLGAVLLTLASLGRLGLGAGEVVNRAPFDTTPARKER